MLPGSFNNPGLTISSQFNVFKALTTITSVNWRWITSPSESVLQMLSEGGIPFEKSSGFATSTRIFPCKFSRPANCNASSETWPEVQLKIISPKEAASPKVPFDASEPFRAVHAMAFSLPAVREPILTLCPSDTNFVPKALPTIPVPRIAIFFMTFFDIANIKHFVGTKV